MDDLNKRTFQQRQAPAWANFVARHKGQWYWEESLRQENGKRFQNINSEGGAVPRYNNSTSKGWDKAYRLPAVPAVAPEPYIVDELPPVPTSELYLSNTGRRWVDLKLEQTCISIGHDSTGRRVRVSVATARDMAHDLIRMAAELERREAE